MRRSMVRALTRPLVLAAAVAAVKALGAGNVAIAATMAEPERGTAHQPQPVPADVYARAV